MASSISSDNSSRRSTRSGSGGNCSSRRKVAGGGQGGRLWQREVAGDDSGLSNGSSRSNYHVFSEHINTALREKDSALMNKYSLYN